eukprot:3507997-Prymnesium_polylepis.2
MRGPCHCIREVCVLRRLVARCMQGTSSEAARAGACTLRIFLSCFSVSTGGVLRASDSRSLRGCPSW